MSEFKVGECYKTRGGYEAQVLDVNFNSGGPMTIIGKIRINGREEVRTWTKDGRYSNNGPNGYDLLPPVEHKELWVNVNKRQAAIWSSKQKADRGADSTRLGLIRIAIEGDDFTVEKVTG